MEAAAALVGGAALSGFFDALFEKLFLLLGGVLASLMLKDDVTKEMKTWRMGLLAIRLVLEDAEEQQQKESVSLWLQDLEDLAHQMEDILDLFSYEAGRHHLELKGAPVPPSVIDSDTIAEVGCITKSLQGLKETMSAFGLTEKVVGVGGSHSKRRMSDRSHILNEPDVYGRDVEKRKIIEWLLKEEDRGMGVIPIVGMGGLGKTTLAKCVFNDDTVKQHFHRTFWVCVSQDFDPLKITRTVFQKMAPDARDLIDLSTMHDKLVGELRGKKFLVVLDDLWNDECGDWEDLVAPFKMAAEGSGSKIIVTTRSGRVADTVRTTERMGIERLTEKDCWLVFCRSANRDFDKNPNGRLERIGRKIVKKCGGVPLAAKVMGGLLRCKDDEKIWEAVLENKSLRSKEGKENLMSILQMSYKSLPSRVKRCFSFCAVYPEDYNLHEKEVALNWWGAGLVSNEEEGRDCFNEMVERSLLLPFGDAFVMHDLVRDLAKTISKETCCVFREGEELSLRTRNMFSKEEVQKVATDLGDNMFLKETELKKFANDLGNLNFLRVFIMEEFHGLYSIETVNSAFSKLKRVRVLRLRMLINEIPKSVQKMVLLRQLDLSGSAIESLPESICYLYNLEILNLRSCFFLRSLPERIGFLCKLSYLDLKRSYRISELPLSLKELKKLKTLTNFIVGKREGLNISSIAEWKHLEGELTISNLKNVASWEEARMADLESKSIQSLILKWKLNDNDDEAMKAMEAVSDSDEKAMRVMEALRPCEKLEEIQIIEYPNGSCPSWLFNLSYLTVLQLLCCPLLEITLPKLPLLVTLRIEECHTVDCHDDFSVKNLQVCQIVDRVGSGNVMICSKMFKEKVREATRIIKRLWVGYYGRFSEENEWIVPGWDFIADDCSISNSLNVFYQHYEDHFPASCLHDLEHLRIWWCDSLKILSPAREFLPHRLKQLELRHCPYLDINMEQTNSSLESISVKRCPIVTQRLSRFVHNFVSLSELEIKECDATTLKALLQNAGRLQMLTTLLLSDCEDAETFPPEETELPPSLVYLMISNFASLEMLGPLPLSVTHLHIVSCPILCQKILANEESLLSKIPHIENAIYDTRFGKGCITRHFISSMITYPEKYSLKVEELRLKHFNVN